MKPRERASVSNNGVLTIRRPAAGRRAIRRRATKSERYGPPTILYPFARHGKGGSTVSGCRLVKGLAEGGTITPVVVAHSRGPAWRHLVNEGLNVDVVSNSLYKGWGFETYEPRVRTLYKLARSSYAAERWLASNSVDAIHANDDMAAAAWGPAAARRGIPLVWHARQPFGHTWLDRPLLHLASRVICVSAGVRKRFSMTRDPRHITVIHNGVDLESYERSITRAEARRKTGLPDGRPVLGFVGNLNGRKQPDVALDVSIRLHRRGLDHELAIVGADHSRGRIPAQLVQRARAANIEERVHLMGRRDDVPVLMHAFDILLLPSRSEAFGLVIIEAMASAVPVVAFSVDGVPEIIDHGLTGLLVDKDDIDGMRAAVEEVLQDEDLAARLRSAASAVARERFSIAQTAVRVAALYEDLFADAVSME